MLTSEVGVTVYDKGGRPFRAWKKKRADARTEALDIRVYNLAALEILNPNFQVLMAAREEQKKVADVPPPEPEEMPSPKKTFAARLPRRSKWVQGWK